LKALIIGLENDEFISIKKIIENNLDKNEHYYLSSEDDLITVLTSYGPFSFIIQNIDDLHINAEETQNQITEIIGERPYIYIGSQNFIKSQLTNEIVNKVKTNFIVELPIQMPEFKSALASCQNWIKNEEFEQSIQEFPKEEMRAVRIRSFFLFENLPYDIFVEVTPNKYGRIIPKNKFYSHKLIQNYSKKNIKFLHIKKNEHLKLLETSIKNFISILKSNTFDKTKTQKLHTKAIFFMQEYIRSLTVTEEVNELSHILNESISEYARQQKKFNSFLNEIDNIKTINAAEVSVLTAYLCELILIELKWNAEMTKGRLILASILQDIFVPNDELFKIRAINDPFLLQFKEEEQSAFKEHPVKAQEVAKLFQGYTELDFILKEHHEHPAGDGFPAGINSSNLTTISCIFIISTHFISRLCRSEYGISNSKDIINGMKKSYSMGNFKEPMNALIKIFS
jgi:response regulator RpfG family c-di-GMP phosphodiesterase